jgi:ubiquinone/menaquinone biosynthesis C-methylase UbiE
LNAWSSFEANNGGIMGEHKTGQVAGSAAEIYEEFFVPALFAEWPDRVLEAAQVQSGDALLDVGCGTGILAREATDYVGPDGSVVGIDVNEVMLAVAQQQAPNITWKVGPAESLPFEAETFDRVVSQFSLMFFEDPTAAITEMGRILRPGGRIAVAVWDSLDVTPGYAAVAELLEELFGPEVAKSIQAPYSLGDLEQLKALFNAAGMSDVTIHTVTGQARFASVESWVYTDIKGWTLADVIDDEGYERLRQRAPQKLARFVLADGSVQFDAPAHIVTVSPSSA